MRTTDSAARAQFLKLAAWLVPAVGFMLALAAWMLFFSGTIGPAVFFIFLLLDLPLTVGGALLLWWILGRASSTLGNTLLAAGDISPAPSFSREESLISQGRYTEAAGELRDRIAAGPTMMEARLLLADVYRRHLGDAAAARQVLLDARRVDPGRQYDWQVTSALLELYRHGGVADRGRLMTELARCAERYAGTRQGDAAREELRKLKRESE